MPLEKHDQTQQETGTIHNMTRLSPPATALAKNGRLVKILAVGNVEGFSPACWVVNEEGEIDLESTSKFTVIDSHFLPPDARAYAGIASRQQGSKY